MLLFAPIQTCWRPNWMLPEMDFQWDWGTFENPKHSLCEVKQSPGNSMWGLSASTDGETDMHVSVALPFSRCCWGDAVAQTNVAHKESTSNKRNQPDKTLFLVHTVKAKFSETQTVLVACKHNQRPSRKKSRAREKSRNTNVPENKD